MDQSSSIGSETRPSRSPCAATTATRSTSSWPSSADWLETGGGDDAAHRGRQRELERVGERTGGILTEAQDAARRRSAPRRGARGAPDAWSTRTSRPSRARARPTSTPSETARGAMPTPRKARAEADAYADHDRRASLGRRRRGGPRSAERRRDEERGRGRAGGRADRRRGQSAQARDRGGDRRPRAAPRRQCSPSSSGSASGLARRAGDRAPRRPPRPRSAEQERRRRRGRAGRRRVAERRE